MNTESGVHEFYQSIDLNSTTLAAFKQEVITYFFYPIFLTQVITYASENLIKINAFLDSPYISRYLTDEVFLICV